MYQDCQSYKDLQLMCHSLLGGLHSDAMIERDRSCQKLVSCICLTQ